MTRRGAFAAAFAAAALAASGNAGARPAAAPATPWLVYRSPEARWASCASLPRRLTEIRTLPGQVLPARWSITNDPVWSPDGKRIAFSSGPAECTNGDGVGQSGARIWVVDASGRNLHAVTSADRDTGGPLDRSPRWSPDGRRIAFARFDIVRGTGGIYSVRAEGGGLVRLTTRKAIALDWSPDGRTIAFVPGERLAFAESAAARVELLDVGSGRIHGIAAPAPSALAWSPDGKTLAVAEAKRIALLGRDGRAQRVLSTTHRDLDGVTWAPDGRRLAYGDGTAIVVARLDGGPATRVASGGAPHWRPARPAR